MTMKDEAPHGDMIPLTPAQQKYLARLATQLAFAEKEEEMARALHDKASEGKQIANGYINDFAVFCAEELGVQLGTGYQLDVSRNAFVMMPPTNGRAAGGKGSA